MAVDDVIGDVVGLVDQLGLMNQTYFMFSSDHGFQLGEFNILIDKRQMYDQDTRIHLLVRGPGIKPGSTFAYPGTQVDVAPTWLGLAGISSSGMMDGRSIVPLLMDAEDTAVPAATRRHLYDLQGPIGRRESYAASWRDAVFVEYYFNDPNVKCHGKYPTEDTHNNFIGIRYMAGSEFGDVSFTEYQTGDQANATIDFDQVDFVEYFNVAADYWQMDNLWKRGGRGGGPTQKKLHTNLHQWYKCKGDSCP